MRAHGLDALRAIAMLFVIATHAAMSFMVTPIGWAIQDRSHWLGADLYVWIVRAFIMPVFFWLSGFAGGAVFERGGIGGFARHRITRVFVPLALAIVPCSLALDALWDWGRTIAGRASVGANVPKLEASHLPLTLGHLWYLYYLLAISIGAMVVVTVTRRLRVPAFGGLAIMGSAAIVSTAVLVGSGTLALGTPLGFAIDPAVVIYEAAFFAWGWMIHARRDLLARYAAHAWRYLAAAPLLLLVLAGALVDSTTTTSRPPLYAIVASGLFSMAMVAAIIGLCIRYARGPSRLLRFASQTSYGCYIVHFPLLVLLQISLARVAVPGPLKYIAIVVGTIAASLIVVVTAARMARHRTQEIAGDFGGRSTARSVPTIGK